MKNKDYLLFDLDGTLTDPKEGITKAVQYALKHYGIQVDDLDSLCPFIGPPLKDSFQKYYGFPEEQAREVQEDDRSIVKMEDFTSPDELYQELVQRVTKYHPSADISMIEKAYQVAKKAHDGQVRKSGEPYIIHPLCVAIILADLEQVQRWKITALQTLKVLEIKDLCGLMP